ncbi:HCNGP-like protein [Metarhizium robertsii ARSEF 23]|uniref:HCNGP-like protein n=1 Tax=Metarhizium robertsii (strain ARSEF 23 / ATCC MYA-3075) TaxID=655844 RepID=E9EVM7_METRA|nr:HCNGP-like protein [Metarhizium robertsii ARSEF 23]EFZ00299.1 HCNGP-like protein [Metarhizium robertsii ARSEF 23]
MAGLVGYASSDEDDDTSPHAPSPKVYFMSNLVQPQNLIHNQASSPPEGAGTKKISKPASSQQQPSHSLNLLEHPSQPSSTQPEPSQSSSTQPQPQNTNPVTFDSPLPPPESNPPDLPEPPETSAPSSPYTTTRSLIHDLTLPSVPNLDIPPSPPGSPPPQTSSKFQQFLTLKRQGTHFNSKLEQSAALRNPSLTDKLLSFVDLSGPAQYETTLPLELYDPSGFPEWSYRDKLRRAREDVVKAREEKAGGRSSIEFVSGSVHSPGTGGGISREKRKGGWK